MLTVKNKVVLIITYLNFISLVTCGCALDSDTILPVVVMAINAIWLAIFGYANNLFKDRRCE